MQEPERKELMRLVSGWLNEHGDEFVANIIIDAHLGRPDGWLVTRDNLHLLRQYRNSVSGNAQDMINEALKFRGGE